MKTLCGFDSKHPKFNKVKYIRQLREVLKWNKNKGRGTFEFTPGFGKTVCALIILGKLAKNGIKSALIVVPSANLKDQWEGLLSDCFGYVEVQTINTASKPNFSRNVDFVVFDEIHQFVSDSNKRAFLNIKYKWILGLTGTFERVDQKHVLLNRICPVISKIGKLEAIQNKWIADILEINLAVHLNQKIVMNQRALNSKVSEYMSKFESFDDMKNCCNLKIATEYGNIIEQEPKVVQLWAINGMRVIRKRQDFFNNLDHKIDLASEIINHLKLKSISFSQSTDFSNRLCEHVPEMKAYHSKIESETTSVIKTKSYKKIDSAIKFQKSKPGSTLKSSETEHIVSWEENKKVSGVSLAKKNLEDFLNLDLLHISSAKALDVGTDCPQIQLGIDTSRSQSPTQYKQRTARIGRNHYKDGQPIPKFYISLYVPNYIIPNSNDEMKLKKAQQYDPNIIWVDTVQQLFDIIDPILSNQN